MTVFPLLRPCQYDARFTVSELSMFNIIDLIQWYNIYAERTRNDDLYDRCWYEGVGNQGDGNYISIARLSCQDMQYFNMPRKLQILSSIYMISVSGYAVMKRLFSSCCGRENARDRDTSEESEHGKLSSQLRFNLSKPKYRFQFDCKIFYKIKMLALSKPWEDSMELISSLSLFLNLFFEKCQYLPVWLSLVKLHQIALSIDIFNFDLEIFLYN